MNILNRYAKFIAAIVGAVTEAINIGLIPHVAQNYVSIAVAILTALGVAGITNGPSPQVVAVVNDVAAIKDQLAPLPKTGGLAGIVKWLADQAEQHGKNIEAIAENAASNAKAAVEDLFAKKAQPIIAAPGPSSNQPQVGQDGALKPVLDPQPTSGGSTAKPVTEPSFDPPAEATTPAPEPDHLAELAAMLK